MNYVFIENHWAEFSIKVMCRVLQVARSRWYAWLNRRHQLNHRKQFRFTCYAVVPRALTESKPRHGAPRLVNQRPVYNIKTIAASLRRQG